MAGSAVIFYIIDDDLSFGKSLKRMLNALGLRAEYFGSAQSFLDSVPTGHAGFAVVDVHMPSCDGFCLLNKMKEQHYGMPVIIVTGQPDSLTKDQALRSGALGYLAKPFTAEALLELVRRTEPDQSIPPA